jgi:hypothetical protein
MVESVVPKTPPRPQGLQWREVLDDYRVKAGVPAVGKIDAAVTESRLASEESEEAMVTPVNLRKLDADLNRNRLDQIADLVVFLTYGEMIELADAIWKAQPEGMAITQENLPALLHRWSKSRMSGTIDNPDPSETAQ